MIKEFSQLIDIRFPFTSDNDLRRYIEQINTTWYNLKVLEKDFYLTGLLWWIGKQIPDLSFKWWTCLNKVHFPYFRLSEDLDFTLSAENFTASQRKYKAHDIDTIFQQLASKLWRISKKPWHEELLKNKKYTYLTYEFWYKSIISGTDNIKLEISYMPRQYIPSEKLPIQHIYTDIITEVSLFPETTIACLSLDEMFSEKVRAALTRRTPAIRDFYDIYYMITQWYTLEKHKELISYKCQESLNNNSTRTIEKFNIDTYEYLTKNIEQGLWTVVTNMLDFQLQDVYTKLLLFWKQQLK